MTTINDILNGASRRLTRTGSNEALDAEDAADMLEALNDMFSSWLTKGINIGWTANLVQADTFPMDDRHVSGVKAMLAARMAEEFGEVVGRQLAIDAAAGWNAIWADYHLADDMRVENAMINTPSRRRYVWR